MNVNLTDFFNLKFQIVDADEGNNPGLYVGNLIITRILDAIATYEETHVQTHINAIVTAAATEGLQLFVS